MKSILVVVLLFACCYLQGTNAATYNIRPLARSNPGTPATNGQFPYMAAIGASTKDSNTYEYACGGALLSYNWILTSAYCINKNSNADLLVIVGEVQLGSSSKSQTQQSSRVIQAISYPSYQPGSPLYDIGLLKTLDFFNTSHSVGFVPLPPNSISSMPDGTNLLFAGWGSSQSQSASILQYDKLPSTTNSKCSSYGSSFGTAGSVPPDSMMCAGYSSQDESVVCATDTGSPLIISHGKTLVGIASYINTCGTKNQPSIFTNVGSYTNWISQYVGANSNHQSAGTHTGGKPQCKTVNSPSTTSNPTGNPNNNGGSGNPNNNGGGWYPPNNSGQRSANNNNGGSWYPPQNGDYQSNNPGYPSGVTGSSWNPNNPGQQQPYPDASGQSSYPGVTGDPCVIANPVIIPLDGPGVGSVFTSSKIITFSSLFLSVLYLFWR